MKKIILILITLILVSCSLKQINAEPKPTKKVARKKRVFPKKPKPKVEIRIGEMEEYEFKPFQPSIRYVTYIKCYSGNFIYLDEIIVGRVNVDMPESIYMTVDKLVNRIKNNCVYSERQLTVRELEEFLKALKKKAKEKELKKKVKKIY